MAGERQGTEAGEGGRGWEAGRGRKIQHTKVGFVCWISMQPRDLRVVTPRHEEAVHLFIIASAAAVAASALARERKRG